MLRARYVAGAALAAASLLLAGCAGGSGPEPSPTPSPSASPTAEPTPPPVLPETAYRLVFREFGQTEDVIWRVSSADVANREEIARIPHREGFGIKPSISPDGKLLAYLTLPDFAISAQSSQAELYVMVLESKEAAKLADGMDMTYTPMWSPDSRWVYARALAGPEFLSAEVRIMRVWVPRKDDPTPTPSPRPSPGVATPSPAPTREPVEIVMKDTVANVLSFVPVGFAGDEKSMFFAQVQGGTGGGTLLGMYSPATTEAIERVRKIEDEARQAAEEENRRRAEEAQAAGNPPPQETATPVPSPTPVARLVVELSDQVAFDFDLNPDAHKLSYLVQEFAGDEIQNRAYVADFIKAEAAALPANGLPPGNHLRPAWHPDGRLTVGVLPSDGLSVLALVSIADGGVTFLRPAESGFDEPRAWSPDGVWLAVAHSSGGTLVNRGASRLDLVAAGGQRVTVIQGADNVTEDSVIGWMQVPPPEG